MDRSVESILHDVRELDRDSRIVLAERILDEAISSSELDIATREEIRNRVDAYRRGDLKDENVQPMFDRARQMIDAKKRR